MSKAFMLAAVAGMALTASGAASEANAAETAARDFGARPDVLQMSLSPDGKRVAITRSIKGAASAVFVADLTAGAQPKAILSSTGRPDQLGGCEWSTPTRLICTIGGTIPRGGENVHITRLYTINADGSDMKELSGETKEALYGMAQDGGGVIDWLGDNGKGGAVLMTRTYGAQTTTGTMLGSTRDGLGVEQVDTRTLERRPVEQPRPTASEYISDGHGTVRVMSVVATSDEGMVRGRTTYFYRKANSRAWLPLSTVITRPTGQTGFIPMAVDRDLDVVYGFEGLDGRSALYRVSLDGSMKRELVLDNERVDVDGLIQIGRQHRVVGASYATDKRQGVFFDPALKALGASLGKALRGKPIIEFVDASADEQQLLLFAGSDNDPGRYYVYDKPTRKLTEILPVRPQLEQTRLATVTPITFPAADGTMIPAYLTLPPGSDGKNLPAIVMPHGGPEARDEWGFDWLSQFFANRGYAVLQPNYRGSTGYGIKWFEKNGFQSWRIAIGDVNDAGRYLSSSGIAAPGKLAIFGWSYGGYAALQSAVLDPQLFKAIVAVAPVTDLDTWRNEFRDYADFALQDARVGHGPEVRAGSPAQNAARIAAPVLLFHGNLDRNVGVGESRMMASRLKGAGKQVEYVEYKGLTHQLDDADVRAEMLGKSDAFLRKAMGLAG